jgi:hypothetical protein
MKIIAGQATAWPFPVTALRKIVMHDLPAPGHLAAAQYVVFARRR